MPNTGCPAGRDASSALVSAGGLFVCQYPVLMCPPSMAYRHLRTGQLPGIAATCARSASAVPGLPRPRDCRVKTCMNA